MKIEKIKEILDAIYSMGIILVLIISVFSWLIVPIQMSITLMAASIIPTIWVVVNIKFYGWLK